MDKVIFLTLGLLFFIIPVTSSTSGLKKVSKAQTKQQTANQEVTLVWAVERYCIDGVLCGQLLGFDWKNCGAPDAPAVLKTLNVSPDPVSIPGDMQASVSGSTSVELAAPLAGSYSLPQSDFYLPIMELPSWLTNGNYRFQGVLGMQDKELGCLRVSLSLRSN
ncbi:ganglioside GM2 activator isoform 3-T3 [Spinachia spinachia]